MDALSEGVDGVRSSGRPSGARGRNARAGLVTTLLLVIGQFAAYAYVGPFLAHKTGAIATKDLERVVVDTTAQPKAIAHPTDARLMPRAIVKLVDLVIGPAILPESGL